MPTPSPSTSYPTWRYYVTSFRRSQARNLAAYPKRDESLYRGPPRGRLSVSMPRHGYRRATVVVERAAQAEGPLIRAQSNLAPRERAAAAFFFFFFTGSRDHNLRFARFDSTRFFRLRDIRVRGGGERGGGAGGRGGGAGGKAVTA